MQAAIVRDCYSQFCFVRSGLLLPRSDYSTRHADQPVTEELGGAPLYTLACGPVFCGKLTVNSYLRNARQSVKGGSTGLRRWSKRTDGLSQSLSSILTTASVNSGSQTPTWTVGTRDSVL